ncbi:MAG: anticodon nuclease [Williamsia sp.]|nr:anticodon nuclease [Williamsia sp.]
MSKPKIIHEFDDLSKLADKLMNDLVQLDFVVMYAYNGTGKTRVSVEFKNKGKQGGEDKRDTLYFNAFTEDLFIWDNDLANDRERVLKINSDSKFFNGFKELALEERIFSYLERYADFNFKIDYEDWFISFTKGETNNIKISRGEEMMFRWCILLAICELTIDGAEAYDWIKCNLFTLRNTNDSPYFHHVASLSELKQAMDQGIIKTFYFNILRSILERTASFFGSDRFGKCIHGIEDEVLFGRALNLLSHGRYSVYEPIDMSEDNKDLFKKILTTFLEKYQFELPVLLTEEAHTA